MLHKIVLTSVVAAVAPLSLALAQAQVSPPPPASITLGARHAHGVPFRSGFNHTGGGNIDVAQPSPDTVIMTMTGVGVAGGHPCKASVATLSFDLAQDLEINFDRDGRRQRPLQSWS